MVSWDLLQGAVAEQFDAAVEEYLQAKAARDALDAILDQAKKRVADLIPALSDGARSSKYQAYFSTVSTVALDEKKVVDIFGSVPPFIRTKIMFANADLDRLVEAERAAIAPAIIRSERRGPLFINTL